MVTYADYASPGKADHWLACPCSLCNPKPKPAPTKR